MPSNLKDNNHFLFFQGVARLLMTLICWAFPDWRTSTYVNAAAALPAFLIVVFILPESPTWLLSKVSSAVLCRLLSVDIIMLPILFGIQGRLSDIEKSDKKIAKVAGIPYVKKERKIPEKSRRLLDVIRIPEYRKRYADETYTI